MTVSVEWKLAGACVDHPEPEIFFPGKGSPGRDAKAVCVGCPVRETCLLEALANNERYGVWGGLTTAERDRLRSVA